LLVELQVQLAQGGFLRVDRGAQAARGEQRKADHGTGQSEAALVLEEVLGLQGQPVPAP
jgi:hypothetical protein